MSSANSSFPPFSGVQTTCYSGDTPSSRPRNNSPTNMNRKYSEKRQEANARVSPSNSFRSQEPTSSPKPSREQVANIPNPGTLGPMEKESQHGRQPTTEESDAARIERLGRQRPEAFGSLWAEIVFVFSISMSQVLTASSLLFYVAMQNTHNHRNTLCLGLQWSCLHS